YSPYEGWRAAINGSKGRIEVSNVYSNADMKQGEASRIHIFRTDGTEEVVEVNTSAAGHGGGDAKLRKALFEGGIEDPLGQQADSSVGAESLLIGATANRSIAEGRAMKLPDVSPKFVNGSSSR
ncbi:gfo/Idh/MocA family oxidoreductase, partial [Clostridium perfringens]